MATFTGAIGTGSKWLLDRIVGVIAATGINPNFLTFLGLVVNFVAAIMFAVGRFRTGAIIIFIAGFLDMLDGQVARRQNRVTAFGAFVDIGVHQDGLVHVSQLSDSFVKNPSDVVKVQQKVQVTVLEVDLPRKRIALSMKSRPEIGSGSSGSRKNEPADKRQSPNRNSSTKPSQLGGDWFSQALNKKP